MHLTKKYNVKVNNTQAIILGCFGVAAAKLWNVANYEKKNYKELGMDTFPDWYYQKKALKDNFWYKSIQVTGFLREASIGSGGGPTCC